MLLHTGHPMRAGVRLALDPGSVRIGVARSDPTGTLASPLTFVKRGKGDLDQIAALVEETEAIEVIVGFPMSLSGAQGHAAELARQFAVKLAPRVAPVSVRLVDERFTTHTAHDSLRQAGRDGRQRRQAVDAAAAALLLQNALEAERRTGRAPGELVSQ